MWPKIIDKFRCACGYRFPRLGPIGYNLIRKSLPTTISTELFPGVHASLNLRDDVQLWTYWFGTRFEAPTPAMLRDWAAKADCFFDIGANYGFFSFFLHSCFPTLPIYAFEPNPAAFAHLAEICEFNNLSSIAPQPFGLSDVNGKFPFHALSINTGRSSFAPVSEDSRGNAIGIDPQTPMLQTRTFDEFVASEGLAYPPAPSWVAKIDVEGYERKVLIGMTEALRRKAFIGICVEIIEEHLVLIGSAAKDIDVFLARFGYSRLRHPAIPKAAGSTRWDNAFFSPAASEQARVFSAVVGRDAQFPLHED